MVTVFAALGGVSSAQTAISAGQAQYGKKVTICHKGKTITISKKALPAHLRHGDAVGTCSSVKAKKAKAAKAKAAKIKAAKIKAAKVKAAKAKAAKEHAAKEHPAKAKADKAKAEKSQAQEDKKPAKNENPGKGKGKGK